jgi:hypothetical protein
VSFASISCCRGPTEADIESAWRADATAERIGSRGIRPRQELTTASMMPSGERKQVWEAELSAGTQHVAGTLYLLI